MDVYGIDAGGATYYGGTMTERDLNRRLVVTLKRMGRDPQRVENAANPGCPDIEFIDGWIESKFLQRWPKKSGVPVKLSHFTRQQRAWHIRRTLAGGKSFVVLQCADEILVFDGATAAQRLGFIHRDGLYDIAVLSLDHYNDFKMRDWIKSWLDKK
jgi:hypothetical protein